MFRSRELLGLEMTPDSPAAIFESMRGILKNRRGTGTVQHIKVDIESSRPFGGASEVIDRYATIW
jgi:hypothetical protein